MTDVKTWRDVLADYRYLRATLAAIAKPDREMSVEELVDSALNYDTMHGDTAMVVLTKLGRTLDLAVTALDMIDLTCNDAPGPGKRCEECGSCAGYFALQWAQAALL